MATDYETLIPSSVSAELIAAAEQKSVAMTLGNVTRMPAGIESIPVVSVEPDAEWNALGQRKKATTIEWTALRLEAEELACVLAIPQAYVDDAGTPVWEMVRDRVAAAFARRIDETLLFAVAPVPASFPATGVVGVAGAALSGADPLEAIDKGLSAVEGQGLQPTGIASSAAIGGALRAEYRSLGATPDAAPAGTLYGLPVEIAAYWDPSKGDAIVGDWTKLVIGIREDVTFQTSDSAILQDAGGAILANAFQDDLVAMRAYMRLGAAIGRPIAADGSAAEPFSLVDWTATAAGRTSGRAPAEKSKAA